MHSLCDYVLRYRIEAIVNFSAEFVREIQVDQKRRYNELKESTLPSAVMAKKTKEFRCPARDQMQALVNYKNNEQLDLSEDIQNQIVTFHLHLNNITQIKERTDEEIDLDDSKNKKSLLTKLVKLLFSSDYIVNETETNDALVVAEKVEEVLQPASIDRSYSKYCLIH